MNREIMKAEDSYDFYKEETLMLHDRINKAVEYINKYGRECGNGEQYFTTSTPINYLLDILKGCDKNDNK